MRGGFTFCDIDIADIGLYYAPELQDAYVYRPAEISTHIENFEGHNGGYYYGSWYSPKEFTLRCYFENSKIDKGIMEQTYSLFKLGRSGKLVFNRRPWCYYYATVTDPIETEFTNYENGIVTIHLKAMYPFARSDIITNLRSEQYHDFIMKSSAAFDKAGMDTQKEFTNITEMNLSPILLANPGQERAALGVAIAGDVGDGVIISNATTGQSMKFVAITSAATTYLNRYVLVDPINGKTSLVGPDVNKLAFLYHEYGFLHLDSCYPATRDVYITYVGGNQIEVLNLLNANHVGRYIFIHDKWMRIVAQPDRHTLQVEGTIATSGSERSTIMKMNELYIKPISTMNISSLKFIFKPTYA